jgi:hypothetical protein
MLETPMKNAPQDFEDETLDLDDDDADQWDDDWDEETLGLDWNEADAQNLVRDVIPARGPADY